MDLKLAGKRALVTGSTSGIGIGIAKSLAAEGAFVILHGRSEDRARAVADEITAAGGQVAVALGDLATASGAQATADAARQAGDVDILVNNAGGVAEGKVLPWFEGDLADWSAAYETNTLSAVRMIRLLAPEMKQRGWGRIIQISSSGASFPDSRSADYAASKAAMVNLTVSLSKALANTNVTANTVTPGVIRTPAMEKWFTALGAEKGWSKDFDAIAERVIKDYTRQSVGRLGLASDVGAMVAFLASPVADFVTGANFRVDGGHGATIN